MNELNLSEKIRQRLFEEDVKEFIRKLKEEIPPCLITPTSDGTRYNIHEIIDKLAGDKDE